MRGFGLGLIAATLLTMIIPIYALFADPLAAMSESALFYVFFVFCPLLLGIALMYFGQRRRSKGNKVSR